MIPWKDLTMARILHSPASTLAEVRAPTENIAIHRVLAETVVAVGMGTVAVLGVYTVPSIRQPSPYRQSNELQLPVPVNGTGYTRIVYGRDGRLYGMRAFFFKPLFFLGKCFSRVSFYSESPFRV